MHSPANATNAKPIITLIPAFLFVLITERSQIKAQAPKTLIIEVLASRFFNSL
jgi:hypothetical protein